VRLHLWIPPEHVFLDLMSGRREDRVAFQDMLAAARSGRVAAIVVLHTSRFARNALVSRKYKDELRQRGVKVIAINAPFDTARPEGKFAERMMEAVDEFTSDTIGWWAASACVRSTSAANRSTCSPRPSTGPLTGSCSRTRSSPRRCSKAPAATPRAGRASATSPAGASARGLRTPSGRALTDEWWRNVLANPTNAGLVGYHRKRGGTELHKAAFAGFLPLELFQRVQQVREERARRPKQGARYRVYLLSGLARCASCGGRVSACEGRRMRCRRSAQHARCKESSAPGSARRSCSRRDLKVKVAALVRTCP